MSLESQSDQTSSTRDSDELTRLRQIILGKDGKHLLSALEPHTRKLVGDVLVQALHDRQKKDNSIQHVVAPMVEKTVEKSVANHSEQFISILYPLVGSLVRKSVSAFLSQFIERTNDIIENALSPKGLKWRFQAWQAGVKYSQFVAGQTYVYKIEQLLLIHRETGLLLKSVSANVEGDADADLVSSMLSAINEFVADSFSKENSERQLDEVKTDDFTLLISSSPHALLVAAVTGIVPHDVRARLQELLDSIHSVHREDLQNFNGDTLPFEVTDIQLRENLAAQVKPEYEKKNKIPWFGWAAFCAILFALAFWGNSAWQSQQIYQSLLTLNQEPGVLITKIIDGSDGKFEVTVLRDAESESLQDWVASHGLSTNDVMFREQSFISVEPEIVKRKLLKLLNRYPQIDVIDDLKITLSGDLNWQDMQQFNAALAALPGVNVLQIDRSQLQLIEVSLQASDQPAIQRQLFEQLVGEISRVNIEFDSGDAELNPVAMDNIIALTKILKDALKTAQNLNLSANLIIIGASDSSGASSTNLRLSLARANAVKAALINQGIPVSQLYATGIGEINLSDNAVATRRVMFNLMYADNKSAS
ncbi:OmpA family protein [Alteromonas flava]|uniref:OmpA family protein n=1 Tax=Alteromonas flava TaxID=2048003 RepID=UPI000C2938BE|nr:OmpA family protein [Alteromonas flava]